jgi:hypothetical protein
VRQDRQEQTVLLDHKEYKV